MASAKDIKLKVIPSKVANNFVRKYHYSGKFVQNSTLHFGVFLNNILHGVMQFGSPLDKRKVLPLVSGTLWNEMLELNRMAFDDILPKNSESRAISIAMKLISKNAPHIKWVLSFADGAQCGDGTIYRASGFVLTSIKKNDQIWQAPDGHSRFSRMSLTDGKSKVEQQKARTISRVTATKGKHIGENGAASMKSYIDAGFKPIAGYQLRYIYFIHKQEIKNLTCPILPFSEIEKRQAGMYKGEKRATSICSDASAFQAEEGGANPTVALQDL